MARDHARIGIEREAGYLPLIDQHITPPARYTREHNKKAARGVLETPDLGPTTVTTEES